MNLRVEEIFKEAMKGESLRSKLDDQIQERIGQTGRDCSLIVMNPRTWYKLFEDCVTSRNIKEINPHKEISALSYMGIKVLRSLDVEEDSFEVR